MRPYSCLVQLSLWVTLVIATVVISLTPGAGAINTMGNALSHGWRRSFWGVMGQQAALIVHLLIVALGVGVLVASSPVAFNVIRYVGAAYLVYLGIRQLLTKPTVDESDEGLARARSESAWSIFRRGFWVNLLNPKAIVFFLAFLPQFIRPDEPLVSQYLIVAVTVVAIDVVVMWGFFATAARGFRRFTHTVRGQRVLNTTFGVLFIAVAAVLAFVH